MGSVTRRCVMEGITGLSSNVNIRRAHIPDVPQIHHLISDAAEFGLMLPRPLASLYENIREFHVAVSVEQDDQVLGVSGLSIIWANLAEVCSLVVSPDCRGQGVGGRLVQACLEEAHTLGIPRVMTLTYEQAFFERQGFTVVDRQQLPLKVWSECVRCPKNQACDEIAMIKVFSDLPMPDAEKPAVPPPQQYVVPVVRRNTS